MLTQQQLEEIREDDIALGDDIRFHAEVYTHRRQLLELVDELLRAQQPQPAIHRDAGIIAFAPKTVAEALAEAGVHAWEEKIIAPFWTELYVPADKVEAAKKAVEVTKPTAARVDVLPWTRE